MDPPTYPFEETSFMDGPLMYRLICQKPAHFLSAQMALMSTFFQMYIVLGMYNFG